MQACRRIGKTGKIFPGFGMEVNTVFAMYHSIIFVEVTLRDH